MLTAMFKQLLKPIIHIFRGYGSPFLYPVLFSLQKFEAHIFSGPQSEGLNKGNVRLAYDSVSDKLDVLDIAESWTMAVKGKNFVCNVSIAL